MSKISIVYWSGTGNTEIMANKILEGIESAGSSAELKKVADASVEDIKDSNVLVLGCPSMGDEQLEESEMEPFMESIESEIKGKKVALFGSYGWGDGQWMRSWVEKIEDLGGNLINDGLIINYEPDEDGKNQCIELGKEIIKYA